MMFERFADDPWWLQAMGVNFPIWPFSPISAASGGGANC